MRHEAGKTLGLGVGIAGQVSAEDGGVQFAPNLRWRNVPFRSRLESGLGIPIAVTNDVRAAAWGEKTFGAGRGVDDIVCVFVGTGVGGGIINGGRLVQGSANTAGELGHITIVADGRLCRCPNKGCLEAYAGGWAIGERAQEAVHRDNMAGRPLLRIAGSVDAINGVTVTEAFNDGDPLAKVIVEETGHYLAVGVTGIVNALNPSRLILGGGVVEGLPVLVDMVKTHVTKHALAASVQDLSIVKSELGGEAGVIGAAALARSLLE